TVEGPGTLTGLVASLESTVSPALIDPGQTATLTVTLRNGGIPLAATGGSGAVWVRSVPGAAGPITVRVTHPSLGSASASVQVAAVHPPLAAQTASRQPSASLTGVSLTVSAPPGATVAATSPTAWAAVAPGQAVTATWNVTASAQPSTSSGVTLVVAAALTAGGQPASLTTSSVLPVVIPLSAAYDNAGISDDAAPPTTANFDGVGNSFSEEALTAAGFAPGGTVKVGGLSFTWPAVAAGSADNVVAQGQTISIAGSGTNLGFLGASASGSNTGSGTVHYTDGTTSTFPLALADYFNPAASGADVAASMTYCNDSNPATNGGTAGRREQSVGIYFAGAPITAGKPVRAVTLPTGGTIPASGRISGMHVFAIAVG
ncbi:MAG: NEW3 domain-containing protein, partial [Candidatus Dormiibacterota bacterium]